MHPRRRRGLIALLVVALFGGVAVSYRKKLLDANERAFRERYD